MVKGSGFVPENFSKMKASFLAPGEVSLPEAMVDLAGGSVPSF